jgi:hypothetical protein
MDDFDTLLEELRLSQARRRGFESHHPLFFQKVLISIGIDSQDLPHSLYS